MVVPASDRIAKFTQKFDSNIVKLRWDAMKDIAIAKATATFESLAAMESAVLLILNTNTIRNVDKPKHYNFARQIWALIAQGTTDPALTTLATTYFTRWLAEGCDQVTCRAIALNVFSITLP